MAMQKGSYKILLDIKTHLMDKDELSESEIKLYNEILKNCSSYLTPKQIEELKLLPDSDGGGGDGGGGDGGGGDGGDAMNVVDEYLRQLPDLGDIEGDEIPKMDMDLGSSKRRKNLVNQRKDQRNLLDLENLRKDLKN